MLIIVEIPRMEFITLHGTRGYYLLISRINYVRWNVAYTQCSYAYRSFSYTHLHEKMLLEFPGASCWVFFSVICDVHSHAHGGAKQPI